MSRIDYDEVQARARGAHDYRDENFHGRFRRIVAAIPESSRVLDIACGSGTLMDALRKKGCMTVGIDLAPGAIRLARQKNLDVHEADVDLFEQDPAVSEILFAPYDFVIFSKCLMYLRSRNALMQKLRTRHVVIHQANPYYWKALIRRARPRHVGVYLTSGQREIRMTAPDALISWGESYGYRGRRLYGGWLRGPDMVVTLSRLDGFSGSIP